MKSMKFNTKEVKDILEGKKTQTRVILNPQPHKNKVTKWRRELEGWRPFIEHYPEPPNYCGNTIVKWSDKAWKCPYGKPGDKLWVKETWRASEGYNNLNSQLIYIAMAGDTVHCIGYKNDGRDKEGFWGKWRQSNHMPFWASRITLEIIDVRVERVQDIEMLGILKEGLRNKEGWNNSLAYNGRTYMQMRNKFTELWDSMHGKDAWGKNQWVWVITFRRVE